MRAPWIIAAILMITPVGSIICSTIPTGQVAATFADHYNK
jgi:hypothetical protein